MIVGLTGGSGFLGRALAKRLVADGHEVIHVLRPSSGAPAAGTVRRADFADPESLRAGLDGCEAVIHAVGLVNGPEDAVHEVNVGITARVLAALPSSCRRFVFISSAAAAMNKGHYGSCKLEAEELVRNQDTPWVILRPTLIYGPGDTKNLQMMIEWVTGRCLVPVLGGGSFKVQPVHIDDVAQAVGAAVERDVAGRVYNICGPGQVSLRSMLEQLKARTGSRCLFVPVPLRPVQIALGLYAKIVPGTTLPVKQVAELDKHEAFDHSETSRDLGFAPRPFEDGLDWVS